MASAAIGAVVSIASRIFGGMAARAKEATNENLALQQVIVACDSTFAQINQQYNAGNLSASDAMAEVNSVWQWYWQIMTPKIQPNRNGCGSGGGCPNAATSNGEPAGYCSGDIGATCCVGCGPIRLAIENISAALQAGSGNADIPTIYGNHYGVQTRAEYTLTFNAPALSNPIGAVTNTVDSLLGSLGLTNQQASVVPGVAASSGFSTTALLLIGGVAFIGIVLVARG